MITVSVSVPNVPGRYTTLTRVKIFLKTELFDRISGDLSHDTKQYIDKNLSSMAILPTLFGIIFMRILDYSHKL